MAREKMNASMQDEGPKKYDKNARRADGDPRSIFRNPANAPAVPCRGPRRALELVLLTPDSRAGTSGDGEKQSRHA